MSVPSKLDKPLNMSIPADGDPAKFQPKRVSQGIEDSPALSMVENPNFPKDTIKTRKIAFLVADGFDDAAVADMKKALDDRGRISHDGGAATGRVDWRRREECKADFSFLTGSSVLFDAVYIPGGDASVAALKGEPEASNFVDEAYKHCKAIAATGAGVGLLASWLGEKFSEANTTGKLVAEDQGVVTSRGVTARQLRCRLY